MGVARVMMTRHLSLFLLISISAFFTTITTAIKGVDVENPVVDITPTPLAGYVSSGSKDGLLCERVHISGISRLQLKSYASVYRVSAAVSVEIPEKLHTKIQICFQRNATLGLCQCKKDDWKAVQKGLWSSVMSPYVDRYVDVKFAGEIPGSVTVTVEEELQRWRFVCLALGFVLLMLAPIISKWVPFYYSSSMAIGVLIVVIILLFQGMKLLPTGRKNVFYLTVYGSVLGAGSFLLHHFSALVNSILVNFGLSEEMHNPVSVFLLVGIVLAGAALGYWLVRKYVISDDGDVDRGVAQFVKWAMRMIAITFIFQSTYDTLLAVAAVASFLACSFLLTSVKWHARDSPSYSGNEDIMSPRSRGRATVKHNRAEFFSRSARTSPRENLWKGPRSSPALAESPVKGLVSSRSSVRSPRKQDDHYSTFHTTPNRKKFSKKEYEEFTRESTKQAMAKWASSPEFADWVIKNADRIQVVDETSSDDTIGSSSDSTDENIIDTSSGINLFKWR